MKRLFNDKGHCPLIAKVMVIDDQITSRIIVESIVKSIGDNISVRTFDNALSALNIAQYDPPDLIVADYQMPEMDGLELTKKIRNTPGCEDVPVIIVTIVDDRAVMYEALEAGATDFLTKPLDHYECKVRCRNLLTMRRQQQIIRDRAGTMNTLVKQATETTQSREKEAIALLARVGEYKGHASGMHQKRVGITSRIIAETLGMDEEFCTVIEIAAQLHDIGNVGIPDRIVLKQGLLSDEELEIIRTHTKIGYELLRSGSSPYLQMAAIISISHHEKYDGTGYPAGLKGEEIPMSGRIVAVADVFDTLIARRPYREALSADRAIHEMNRLSGTHFDPACVNALLGKIDLVLSSKDKLRSIHN